MKSLLSFCAVLFCVSLNWAQITTPLPSPNSFLRQTVGLTDVEIEYARPGVKDRSIFAEDGLVPFGQIWRTGANTATTISFSDGSGNTATLQSRCYCCRQD